jgi:hypothetical protein
LLRASGFKRSPHLPISAQACLLDPLVHTISPLPVRLCCLAVVFASAASAPTRTAAQNHFPPAALTWRCTQGFDASYHVLCLPDAGAPAARSISVAEPAPRSGAAADLVPVAERGIAEVFSADAWRVPLHSAPVDPVRVQALLESALCGKRSSCAVRYDASAVRSVRR